MGSNEELDLLAALNDAALGLGELGWDIEQVVSQITQLSDEWPRAALEEEDK